MYGSGYMWHRHNSAARLYFWLKKYPALSFNITTLSLDLILMMDVSLPNDIIYYKINKTVISNVTWLSAYHCQENELASAGTPRSISLNDYSMERDEPGHGLRQAYFSNQEYYQRLEELKRTHLRNMAELERMYIGRSKVPSEEEGGDSGLKREEAYVVDSPRYDMSSAWQNMLCTLFYIS